MTKFFFSLFLLLSFTLSATTQSTPIIRAAIDIGMGGPKLQIAEVDLTTNKIVKMLHTQRYFVNFYESISKSDDHQLCPEIRAQGLKAFKEAVDMAHAFKVDGVIAIATAAFRSAANGIEFAHDIQKETGIQVHIIDQNLEGKLAFQAVLSRMNVQADDLVVWDIGGGSIQFIGTAFDGSYVVDCGKEGAGIFKDFIIENIQQRNVKEFLSPNPMSAEDIIQATIYAQNLSQHVDEIFKDKIKCSTTPIVGAGSVFGYGIATRVSGKNPFSIHDLTQVVHDLIGKTDADLGGGEFAFCEGSNSVLALGFMQGLGIQQMHIINVNNADDAMIYASFWKQHILEKGNSSMNQQKFEVIKKLNLPLGQYAIIGSGALGIRNLRKIEDIDLIVTPELRDILEAKYGVTDDGKVKKIIFAGEDDIEVFWEGSFYTNQKDEGEPTIAVRIAQAEIIEGLPFDSLDHVLYFKRKMKRNKDLQDILLIEEWLKTHF